MMPHGCIRAIIRDITRGVSRAASSSFGGGDVFWGIAYACLVWLGLCLLLSSFVYLLPPARCSVLLCVSSYTVV